MAKLQQTTLKLADGLQIAYAEHGDRAGPALVLIHGYTDSLHSQSRLIAQLPGWIRTIAITLRGHGDSSKVPSTFRMEEHAHDVARVLDALAVRHAVIAGHSLGSMVAQRFAIAFPERTIGLVLLGGFRTLRGSEVLEATWRETLQTLVDPVDPEMVRAFQMSTVERPVPAAFMDMVVDESLKVPAYVWRAAAKSLEEDASRELDRIKVRTALIWGDRDGVASHEEQLALKAALRDADLHVLQGTGHAVHWEEPEAVATLIAHFVRGTQPIAA
jgi:non-heme chloroperoxidase